VAELNVNSRIESISYTDRIDHDYRREADHRIANSLQIVSALVRQRAKNGIIADPHTFLMEIADRIDTVGKLHLFLAQSTTETVELRSYLREVCERLTGALAPAATKYALRCPENCPMAPKTALALALIIAELISNSLKYAHPSGLPTAFTVCCSRVHPEGLKVVYEDDGVGFPEDFDLSADAHVGIQLIELLSKSLAGIHNWHSGPLGVRFEIAIQNIN
jgi:two-component sensor histidine kinase